MTVECPRSCPAGVEAECLTYGGQDPMDRCRWTAMDLTNANTEVVRYCPYELKRVMRLDVCVACFYMHARHVVPRS